MSKDHWDAVLASAPFNATAGRVTSKGYAYTPDVEVTAPEWEAPPLIAKPRSTHFNNPDFTDFTGKSYGRITVLGMFAGGHTRDKALWVCRCSCGRYVGRRAKALKRASPDDRCTLCRHTAHLVQAASGDNARHRAESEKARKW